MSEEESWNARYERNDGTGSGQANLALVREVACLPPGRALDLGCGPGLDAIWLARGGWRVTAVDISGVALAQAAARAAAAGVADRIEWQRRDLGESFPDGTYDLVSAQFLHSWGELPRERILRAAAAAVAPGGVLLIEGHLDHGPYPPEHAHREVVFPTPAEVVTGLELDPGEWEVLRAEAHGRTQTGPDGRAETRTDSTVKARRRVP